MKSKDQILLEEAYRLVLLNEEDVNQTRKVLNNFMDEDQNYTNPSKRKDWQAGQVWPYIEKNLHIILSDKEENGNYPAAPYAAWLLVQHMDAFVDKQKWFFEHLKEEIPRFLKLKFLQDRITLNQIIEKLYRAKKSYYDKLNPNYAKCNPITSCIRDSDLFPSADSEPPRSAKAAYNQLVKANNNPLFVDALDQAYAVGVDTQPSFSG